MDMQQLDEVKEKLDGVHKLLMKQVSFVEVDTVGLDGDKEEEEEEDVKFVSGVGFQNQRYGNKSNNRNFNGLGQESNYNQNSQYQKPFNSNNYTRNCGASSYQNIPPPTLEIKLEAMI